MKSILYIECDVGRNLYLLYFSPTLLREGREIQQNSPPTPHIQD